MISHYRANNETSLHRALTFGGLLFLGLLGLAMCGLLAYYSASFFAPGP